MISFVCVSRYCVMSKFSQRVFYNTRVSWQNLPTVDGRERHGKTSKFQVIFMFILLKVNETALLVTLFIDWLVSYFGCVVFFKERAKIWPRKELNGRSSKDKDEARVYQWVLTRLAQEWSGEWLVGEALAGKERYLVL